MRTRDKFLIGAAAGLGLAWGGRQLLRARRRITLEDRVVVITGASTGHGFIVARQAAQHGARLVLAARNANDLRAAESALDREGARDILIVPTDVTDPDQCHHLIKNAIDRHGRVDILINNAGIIQVGPLEAMTLADFETAMATNFWGTLHCVLAVLPFMRERQFGRIGNVVSCGGKMPVPHLSPYTSSKFALAGLTKALRVELAKDGILVTGVYPGTMRTGGHTHAWIRGNQTAEYTLFALSDTLPLLSSSAEHVARSLWRGVLDGDADVNVGWPAHVAAAVEGLFPNWSAEGLALIGRLLPNVTLTENATQGKDVRGMIPAMMTRQVPAGARPDPVA